MTNEKSCGTIIIDNNKVLLIQQKSGFFGFPKGHMESGESEIETAVRETKEETNIDVIVKENMRFSLSYIQKGTILKEVVYFVAVPINSNNLKVQEKEIKEGFWVDIDDVESKLTFDNLKELWRKVMSELKNNNFC